MQTLALAWLIVALAVVVQQVTAFGFGLVATPLLMWAEPGVTAYPVLLLTLPLMVLILVQTGTPARGRTAAGGRSAAGRVSQPGEDGAHREPFLHRYPLAIAVAAALPGVGVGAVLAAAVPHPVMRIVVGAAVVVFSLLSFTPLRFPGTRAALGVGGFVGGVLTPMTATSGPPVVLVYGDTDLRRRQINLTVYFLAVTVLALVLPALTDRAGLLVGLRTAVELLPGMAVGLLLDRPVRRRIRNPRVVLVGAQLLCLLSGAVLIATAG